jgi:tRNA dimethylallyltransferase
MPKPIPVILGPTACGKTEIAVQIAHKLHGEIISADSRQVYRGMDIGTGKDLQSYQIEGVTIPYHLIDIVDPGYEYNIFEFQRDATMALNGIEDRGNLPIICGGSGLYLETILFHYQMPALETDTKLEKELASMDVEALTSKLKSLRIPHNTTDLTDRKRLIKAIRIGMLERQTNAQQPSFDPTRFVVFGVNPGRSVVRERITQRLHHRLKNGMVEEVERLLSHGISGESLKFYGLEYKYITLYLEGSLGYDEMVEQLNIKIHQFAKRQMTWFRRMEKKGVAIHWIDHDALENILIGLSRKANI